MFGFGKKKQEQYEVLEPIQQNKNEITVQVKDIKQYLVDEYKRVEDLNYKLKMQENELEKYKELKFKYDAALVTLDEFDKRIGNKDNEIDKLKRRIKEKDEKIETTNDELNSYKILINQTKFTKEDIEQEIRDDFAQELIQEFNEIKGVISKSKIIEIIQNKS